MERVLLEALSQILRRHLYAVKRLHDLFFELLATLFANFELNESSGLCQDVLLLSSDEIHITALAIDLLKDFKSLFCSAVHDFFQFIPQHCLNVYKRVIYFIVLSLNLSWVWCGGFDGTRDGW